jgi:hypothetical protein
MHHSFQGIRKALLRRRLGAKAQLEATLCRRQRRLQGNGKAPAAASRRRQQLHRKGKAPAAVAAAGEGEAQRQ